MGLLDDEMRLWNARTLWLQWRWAVNSLQNNYARWKAGLGLISYATENFEGNKDNYVNFVLFGSPMLHIIYCILRTSTEAQPYNIVTIYKWFVRWVTVISASLYHIDALISNSIEFTSKETIRHGCHDCGSGGLGLMFRAASPCKVLPPSSRNLSG